jgi:predicted amidophosphoribosyltransferase
MPFDIDPGGETICGPCHAKAPDFDRARSLFRYDDASKRSSKRAKAGARHV